MFQTVHVQRCLRALKINKNKGLGKGGKILSENSENSIISFKECFTFKGAGGNK